MFAMSTDIPLQAEKSFFLFGPRGTGKTTWLLQSDPYNRLAANPGLPREMIPPAATTKSSSMKSSASRSCSTKSTT